MEFDRARLMNNINKREKHRNWRVGELDRNQYRISFQDVKGR